MKIGIDISQIVYENGVSWYTRNLVENLIEIDKENKYILFGGSLRQIAYFEKFANKFRNDIEKKFFRFPPMVAHVVWNKLHVLPVEVFTGKLDIFHSSDWTQPPSKSFKVTTIHDMIPVKFPKITNPQIVSVHKAKLSWVKKEADKIIAVSQTTKKDLVSFGVSEKKVSVIYEAAAPIFRPQSKEFVDKVLRKYKIPGKYIMGIVGTERKNTDRLIEAFEKVRAGENIKLVLIGKPSSYSEVRGIIYTGHVDYFELPALYSGAEAFVYPSLYEGFGLPILEAFACGTPVVTSNVSCMPEIANSAAVLIDPYDQDSITSGVEEALKNKKTLSLKGFRRSANFDWKKTASQTLEVYGQL